MGKRTLQTFLEVLHALKAHDCIGGYTINGQDVIPEWKEGGSERALRELMNNAKPFGLRRKIERAGLLLVLPQKERDQFDASLFAKVQQSYGSPKSDQE